MLDTKRNIAFLLYYSIMDSSDEELSNSGFSGVGKWIAIASELPCAVIALLLVGHTIGTALWGPSGATWGALVGVLFGFLFGVYSVYLSVTRFEIVERQTQRRKKYIPPLDEILEEPEFLREQKPEE